MNRTTKTYTLVITETVGKDFEGNPTSTYSYTIVRPDGTTRSSMTQSDDFTYMLKNFADVLKGKE